MKLKELEGYMQQVTTFTEPDYRLEQYPTTPHIAARMLFTIDSVYDDIEEKAVGDFGCGGGTLGLGCAILGAGSVLGIDIDPKSLALARQNAEELDLEEETDFIMADIAVLAAHDEGARWGEAARATGAAVLAAAEVEPEPEPEPEQVAESSRAARQAKLDQPSLHRRRPGPGLDTVVMNPPFGTRNKGIDVLFLQHALRKCSNLP